MLVRRLSVVIVFAMCASASLAADDRIPIAVEHDGDDRVGVRIAYELKEAAARSARYRVETASDYTSARISVVSIAIRDGRPESASATSVQFSASFRCPTNSALRQATTHIVTVTGSDRAASTAQGLLASFVEWLEKETGKACLIKDDRGEYVLRPGKLYYGIPFPSGNVGFEHHLRRD
jgi:hypothetical protein